MPKYPKRNRSATPRPPINERANRGGESMFVTTCPACGKQGFTSKQVAKRAAARIHPGVRMRFYRCGQFWHMTSADSDTSAGYRERQAVQEEEPS